MKRIISLIISASIFLQMVIPTARLVTYAADSQGPYKFENLYKQELGEDLGINTSNGGAPEALLGWEIDSKTSGPYVLDYFIGNETAAEQVKFTFNKESSASANAEIEILDLNGNQISKDYRIFDFSNDGKDEVWIPQKDTKIKIPIRNNSKFQGGRVQVGAMEIIFRFSWEENKVYFQTNQIEYGYITPFTLKVDSKPSDTIEVLTGVEGYKVSPIHIEENGTIIGDKKKIEVPNNKEEKPGSKPGVKIDFMRPKQWKTSGVVGSLSGKGFVTLTDIEAKKITATLELSGLAQGSKPKLGFDMGVDVDTGKASEISGIGQDGKRLIYNTVTKTYSIYLAKEDKPEQDKPKHENIVQWKELDVSMILTRIELTLLLEKKDEPTQSLGYFSPQPANEGMNTYLEYTIRRTSKGEAAIELQPYNASAGTMYTYVVESAPSLSEDYVAAWKTLVTQAYKTIGQGKENPITIAIPFSPDQDEQYYRITAQSNRGKMISQILYYQPKKDLVVPPPTPEIESIHNIYVVPPAEAGGAPDTIGFDLTWSAPENSTKNNILDKLLKEGSIYYELFFHEDIKSKEDKGTLSKVFKVSLDEDKIKVTPHAGTAGVGNTSPEVRYSASENTFTMENIVLKNLAEEKWEQLIIDPIEYEKGTKYPKFKHENEMKPKAVPGIYYVTMRALHETTGAAISMGLSNIHETTGAAISMGISNTSNPKSITLSLLEEVIPVPTKIESKAFPDETDSSIIRQSFSWGNVSLDRYIKQMLEPLKLQVGSEGKGKGVYEVYLYQEKNIQESKLTKEEIKVIDLNTIKSSYTLGDEDVKTLRGGGAIRLDYEGISDTGMNNIILGGLDTNQVYYTTIKVRLDITNKAGETVGKPRRSVFSKEHSFTSYVKPSEPGPGERVPLVPKNLHIIPIEPSSNTVAKIGWEAPDYNKQKDEVLYYEMLRVDSRTLVKVQEDNRLFSIKQLLGKDTKDEMAAWRTKELFVTKYDKSPNIADPWWEKAYPEQTTSQLRLEDPDLNPNRIYYYYVRTVLVVDEEEVYSSWVGIPFTTSPIQKPIQLKVENVATYSHDPKREIVVSFLAPIPKGANIPTDYAFDVAVQGELDDEYKHDYSTTRITSTVDDKDIPIGYSHYIYKISGLKPGKRYDIKVSVIDKIVKMDNGQHPMSLYSDRVTTRTHFDQDEQDKDDKFEEYLKYFEDKVEALRRKPYWTLEDRENSFSIKYRSNYIIPEINSTKAYKLEVRDGVSNFTYHMPASVIASTNLSQTSFEIKQGNVTYSVRPSTITTELEELKLALSDIAEKHIKDYYVVFNFSQRPSTNRKDLLTPEISVNIELARLREEDILLEDDIMVTLNDRIKSEKVRFIDGIEIALKRGKILDEDLEVLMNRSVESIQKDHQRDVSNIINQNTHRMVSITNWKKSMLIMVAIEGNAVVEGYLLGWEDTALTTFNVGGGYGIEVTGPGTYAFKGQKINMPVIPGLGGAGDLMAKYQLTDFFGIDGNIDPSRTASKRSVLGAMARVLGAPRGADYTQHLKQMNIKGINNIGMDLPMKKGEAIYLLMQVYEKTHQKPINSVHIKNRNVVSNIKGFNQLHQPYVLVAVDSKIISLGNGIGPNDSMQIKDVLQILTNIMPTVR